MRYEKLVAPTIEELFESQMQRAILSGELSIGERLPTERELSEKMGISKSAVHMGLKRLERSGFVRIEPRQGGYVADWENQGGLETLTALLRSNVFQLEPENLRALIEIREVIEGSAMRNLAKNHTGADILRLRALALEIRDGGRKKPPISPEAAAELAYAFSHYICAKGGRTFSSLILNAFKPFSISLWIEWIRQIGTEQAYSYLDETAVCLRDGDGDRAAEIVHNYNLDFLSHF